MKYHLGLLACILPLFTIQARVVDSCVLAHQGLIDEVQLGKQSVVELVTLIDQFRAEGNTCCVYELNGELQDYWRNLRDFEKVRLYAKRGEKLAEQCGKASQKWDSKHRLISVYLDLLRLDSALIYAEAYFRDVKEGADEEALMIATYDLASVQKEMGDIHEAKDNFLSALDQALSLDPKHRIIPYLYLSLGWVTDLMKDFEAAEEWYMSATDFIENSNVVDYKYLVGIKNNLAYVYMGMGDYHRARRILEEVIADIDSLGIVHKVETEYSLAMVCCYLGDLDSANLWVDLCLADTVEHGVELANRYHMKAYILQTMGNSEEAYQWMYRAKVKADSVHEHEISEVRRSLQVEVAASADRMKLAAEQRALKDAENANERLVFGLVITLLLFAVAVLLVVNLRRRQRAQATELEFEKEQNRRDTLALIQKMEVESLDKSLEAQDRERTRISEDLHDSLGGTLAAIQVSLSMIQETVQTSGTEIARKMYHQAVEQINQAVKDVRRISHNLGDIVLDRGGLEEAIQNLCDTLEQQGRFDLSLEMSGFTHRRLPLAVERNVYRVVQELFQNVLKHARASEVKLQVNLIRNRLSLIMEDNGRGFDPNLKEKQGLGMKNIHSRIQKIGGDLDIDSAPGKGTTVVLNVPLST